MFETRSLRATSDTVAKRSPPGPESVGKPDVSLMTEKVYQPNFLPNRGQLAQDYLFEQGPGGFVEVLRAVVVHRNDRYVLPFTPRDG